MSEDVALVAAVQTHPELSNVQKNMATALRLAFEAAAKGAKIIVLPELCTSGYGLDARSASECSQTKDGYQTESFAEISKRFGCYIVFGYVELGDGLLYNSAAVVGPSGLEGNFRKHNLWGRDNLWAQPSDDLFVNVVTPLGRLGVLICRDAMNQYRKSFKFSTAGKKFYDKGSVDIIALPSNWGGDYGYPDSSWVELVEETRANLIVANRVGQDADIVFKGGSAIIDRNRRIWTNGSNFTSEAVVGGIVI